MLKSALRVLLFTFLSIKSTQYIIGGFSFGGEFTMLWLVVALSALYFFLRPMLKITGLPNEGPGYLFVVFLMTLVTLYVLTIFLPMFMIMPTVISKLLIFGFVLPSKQLTAQWSLVFSSLLITVLIWFFGWLCNPKK